MRRRKGKQIDEKKEKTKDDGRSQKTYAMIKYDQKDYRRVQ